MPFKLSGSESKKNQDVVQIVTQLGWGLKKLFASLSDSLHSKDSVNHKPLKKEEVENASIKNHQFSFGMVYANDLAKVEFEKEKPNFPVGSIIVREKNLAADSKTPETVIAMVKRAKGFSEETGDWEFFVFNGADFKMQKRETTGDCAKCHIQAEKSDWVFRDYLK